MTEAIRHDYEGSSEGGIVHWEIPYSRLTDTTPTPTRPCEVTSLTDSTQLTGTILTIDAGDSVAMIDFTPSMVYYQEVRNVLTYGGAVEATWSVVIQRANGVKCGQLLYLQSQRSQSLIQDHPKILIQVSWETIRAQ